MNTYVHHSKSNYEFPDVDVKIAMHGFYIGSPIIDVSLFLRFPRCLLYHRTEVFMPSKYCFSIWWNKIYFSGLLFFLDIGNRMIEKIY